MSNAMEMKAERVSASEAGDEIFQVLFQANPEQEDGAYVLIQRAWLEEDEGEFSTYYIETHEERLIGHYAAPRAVLTRNSLTLQLPPPTDEIVSIDFAATDENFGEIRRVLGIIFQGDL